MTLARDIAQQLGNTESWSESHDLELIAATLGIEPTGNDMERITGMSAATLQRVRTGEVSRPRAWRHLSVLAAIARELVALVEGATGRPEVDAAGSRRWLQAGSVRTFDGRTVTPIQAMENPTYAVDLLNQLRDSAPR